MIKFCKDVKTQPDFEKFCDYRSHTADVGLRETSNMLNWDHDCLICPELFSVFLDEEAFKND